MKTRGKTVMLYLMDGDVNARIKASVPGWTGVVYKIPRTSLSACKDREHLKQSGVYMLFGFDDKKNKAAIYVGQASVRNDGKALLQRINEHKKEDYWTDAIAVTTTDDTLGPTEISYLEHRFHSLAVAANRCTVVNGQTPHRGNISEEKESELENLIDHTSIIMAAFGNRSFIPIDESALEERSDAQTGSEASIGNPVFQLKTSKAYATGKRTSDGFMVFKGSKLAALPTASCPSHIRAKREQYQSVIDENSTLQEDILFSSPSSASGFVKYASSNGRVDWVTTQGITLQFVEEL